MGHLATTRCNLALLASVLCVSSSPAQTVLEWRRIGNSAVEMALPSVATGPVDRVWFSAGGTGAMLLRWSDDLVSLIEIRFDLDPA